MSSGRDVEVHIVAGDPDGRSKLRDAIAAHAPTVGFEVIMHGELLDSGAPTLTLRRVTTASAERGRYIGLDRASDEPGVFSRPECVFAYCPHGGDCKLRSECRHQRADTADETKPREEK